MTCSRSLHAIVAAVACALLTAPAALAATTTTTPASGENTPLNLDRIPAAEHASGGGGGGGIVRTIVGLAVVIGVILGLHWLLKQIKSGRESRSSSGLGLQSLSTLALGSGRSLHLVRAGAEIVLVGSAEHAVTPIRVYREAEARALGLLDDAEDFDGDDDGAGDGRPMMAGARPTPLLLDLFRRFQRRTVRG